MTKDQVGYMAYGVGKPADRRTCKMIKGHICMYLVINIGGVNLMEEPGTTIIHKAFCRAVDELEEYGYLTLNSLENIVRDEYLMAVNAVRSEKFVRWFDKYEHIFEETKRSVEESENAVNKAILLDCCNDYMNIWHP